jgi:site-specific recombinase XerD
MVARPAGPGNGGKPKTVASAVEESFLDNQTCDRTREVYGRVLRAFRAFLGRDLLTATTEEIIAFRNGLSGQARATIGLKLTVLRSFYTWARRRGQIGESPAADVKGPRVPTESPTEYLTTDEAARLLAAVDRNTEIGRRDLAMLRLGLKCGLRESEILDLNWGDLTTREGEKGMRHVVVVRGKGGKVRELPLPADVYLALQEHRGSRDPAPDEPIFQGTTTAGRRHGRLSRQGIAARAQRYAKLAGLKKRASPHVWRHTAISNWLTNAATIEQCRRAAGHSSIRTTQRYLHAKNDVDESAVDFSTLRLPI